MLMNYKFAQIPHRNQNILVDYIFLFTTVASREMTHLWSQMDVDMKLVISPEASVNVVYEQNRKHFLSVPIVDTIDHRLLLDCT